MSENKDLIQRLAAAEAEVAAVRAELAKAQEPEPWARWKPERGGCYYYVSSSGETRSYPWDGSYVDTEFHDFGNCFSTREAAERHAKRIRSMVPTCPVPKVGEKVWVAEYHGSHIPTNWGGAAWQVAAYNLGRIKPTKDDADAWSEEFADAWTTVEDAS